MITLNPRTAIAYALVIALQYGVSRGAIVGIKNGVTWKHLP